MMNDSTIHLGQFFRNRREPGKSGLPVISVTMADGLIHRDTLDRKADGTLLPEEHLLIHEGDIAYDMMRMWQGASGLARQDGIVSPAYVVLAPRSGIDPLFASYWFKSARMIYLFWAYSYGITGDRLRLYYKDFARIPVTVPPKQEQMLIGKILAAWDRAIDTLERLIEAKRTLKKGLAQQLLTGRRRLPGFDGEWREVPLKKLCSISYGRSQRSLLSTDGKYPIYGTGGVVGRTDECLCPGRAIIIGRKGSIDNPILANDPFWAIDTTFYVEPSSETSIEWLFQKFLTVEWWRYNEASGVPSLSRETLYNIHFSIPSIDEQKPIAATLGAADRKIALLECKLSALREQKKGLMQRLLTGRLPVKVEG